MRIRLSMLSLAALSAILACLGVSASEPRVVWSYEAQSNLYAPPLVTDVWANPGKESIISDSDVRRLRCVDASGRLVWEYDGRWSKRLTSGAALSWTARPGQGTLVIGNADGKLNCVDAATGQELWRIEAGGIEWGIALWADVNADQRDEVVAGTENAGIAVFTADGKEIWRYRGEGEGRALSVRFPIAAADVDADGRAEIFAADRVGPVCVNGDGTLRWSMPVDDDLVSWMVIADADVDGAPELYVTSADDNAVYAFDARNGALRWRAAMFGRAETCSSSSPAIGDVDQKDGEEEIVVPDTFGYVYCLTSKGDLRWVFATDKRTHGAVSLGDVDGDEEVEVLVASGDHHLYCLDADGQLEWKYPAALRLISAAAIADVDDDGKTDILFGGSDRTLRCLTLGGRYRPELVPWASRRFDMAQTGSCFGKRASAAREKVRETIELLVNGGFEQGKEAGDPKEYPQNPGRAERRKMQPRGWHAEKGAVTVWGLDSETKAEGGASMRVAGEDGSVSVASSLVEAPAGLRTSAASVLMRGAAPAKAFVRWIGSRGVLREDALAKSQSPSPDGWTRLEVAEVMMPETARWLQLVLAAEGETWWDDAHVLASVAASRMLRPFVNQVGYDVGAPKRFTAQSNFVAKNAGFEVIAPDGSVAYSALLKHEGRISGAYGNDWGYEYWRGDFSEFDRPGRYRVRIALDGMTEMSWPFEIGEGLLWEKTSRPAYRFFYYQRCGMEIPGYHKACHVDDARSEDGKRQFDLWGGWHDAGDYNKYQNAPYVLRLAAAHGVRQSAFDRQDEDGNGISDFLDEIVWGGEHVRRMMAPDGSAYGGITSGYGFWGPPEIETDNKPGTGDERPVTGAETGNDSSEHLAAMAKIARYARDQAPWVEAADRGLQWALASGKRGPWVFGAALDLLVATQDEKYKALAKDLFPGFSPETVESIRLYDALFHEDHTEQLREMLVKQADEMVDLAANPFGVYTFGPKEKPNFFGTPAGQGGWHVGTSSHLLNAAATVALAHRYAPDPRYLAFVYDQINWTLGNNPYDISLMEGAGSAFPPTYHQRLTFGGVPRGAIPGSVVNGITWRDVYDDRPYFDMSGLDIPSFQSNEVWLPHNTAYLAALTNLYAAHPTK